MSTGGHFFAAGSHPIANFAPTKITFHTPTTVANTMTVMGGVTANGNVVCAPGSHIGFAEIKPGVMMESQWPGGDQDRYGIAHNTSVMRMYTANLVNYDTFVCMSFCTSADTYFDAIAASKREVLFRVNTYMAPNTMVTWKSGTVKPNMIEISGGADTTADSTNVRGLGYDSNKIMRYNARENELHRFYAGDTRLMQLSNTHIYSYSDTQVQNANLTVYAGYVRTTVGPVRCQVIGVWPNKLCLYAPAGANPDDRTETNISGLGTTTNTLQVRAAVVNEENQHSYTTFQSNTNPIGSIGFGVLTGNGASGMSGRLRLGPGFREWQLHLEYNSAAKASTSTWSAPSDERLKTDIELANLDICYDTIRALPLKRFRWGDPVRTKTRDQRVIGWIAQDVERYIPKAITVTNEYGFEDFRVLNQDQILKTMYGALQKAIAKIEALETELDEAEALAAVRRADSSAASLQ